MPMQSETTVRMNYNDALSLAQNGSRVAREAWPEGKFVYAVKPGKRADLFNVVTPGPYNREPADNIYFPAGGDVYGDDWYVIPFVEHEEEPGE